MRPLRCRACRRGPPTVGTAAIVAVLAFTGCADPGGGHDPEAWPTASPASHGLDAERLEAVAQRLRTGRYGDVGSFLVARHGVLVMERYFGIDVSDELVDVASVTKSVTSALIGLAVDAGRIGGVATPLHTLLPRYDDLFAADPAKRAITLEHVLTMRSGLAWDESLPPSLLPGDSGDWIRLVLRQPLVDVPGTRFRYSTGSVLLLSGVLQGAYGVSAAQLAARDLFEPLGIRDYRWPADETGITPTGAGLSLRARDMAKIGQLFLGNGVYRGRRVLSEAWVRRAATPHVPLASGDRYGYLWWVLPTHTDAGQPAPADAYYAAGSGEKHIFVLPSVEMVVVVTAYNFGPGFIVPVEFVTSEILPAVLDAR